jgi:hypothetical protein
MPTLVFPSQTRIAVFVASQGSWAKRQNYVFVQLIAVEDVSDPQLRERYAAYKQQLVARGCTGDPASAAWENRYEQLLFHGCAEEALASIASKGFLQKFQTTGAGSWQRFGLGYYFALHSSKSHEYPVAQMKALKPGRHRRSMLLCRVAKGKVFRTEVNMDHLQGAAPEGYHSVLGIATEDGPLNYDEYVVYNPAAIQPWLKCVYEFEKLDVPDPMTTLLDHSGIPAEFMGLSRAQIEELLVDVILPEGGQGGGAECAEEAAVAEGVPEHKTLRTLREELQGLSLSELIKRAEDAPLEPAAIAVAEQGGKSAFVTVMVNHAHVVELIFAEANRKMQALAASEDFEAMVTALTQLASLAAEKQASAAYSALRDRHDTIEAAQSDAEGICRLLAAPELGAELATVCCERVLKIGDGGKGKLTAEGTAFNAAGGCKALVAAMRSHIAVTNLQAEACAALEVLARGAQGQSAVVAAGGAEAVVRALRAHAGVAAVQEKGCLAAGKLAFRAGPRWSAEGQARLLAAGGAEAVVRALRAHVGVAAVQEWGCRAAINLAANSAEGKAAVLDAGGAEAMVRAMRAHVGVAAVQEAGCLAAINLTFKCAEGKDALRRAGADKQAQAAARNHPSHAGVQKRSAGLLKVLSR